MTIRTRLFLGAGALVLALVAVQLWLQTRQLRAIERGLGEVATTVGSALLTGPDGPARWELKAAEVEAEAETSGPVVHRWEWRTGAKDHSGAVHDVEKVVVIPPAPPKAATARELAEAARVGRLHQKLKAVVKAKRLQAKEVARIQREAGERMQEAQVRLEVVRERANRFLVIRGVPGGEEQIELPVSPTVGMVRSTMRQGLAAGALLLVVGLAGAAVLAHRVARPLQSLAGGVEALGRGELGAQVPVSGSGEVVEVQRAFNLMSARLARLEGEKQRWREREQLAELGRLAHGLAHTVRNPLNTLGLAVEELARISHRPAAAARDAPALATFSRLRVLDGPPSPTPRPSGRKHHHHRRLARFASRGGEKCGLTAGGSGDQAALAATARSQIQRIDRWLRSFLALGAGEAARPEPCDLTSLAQEVALEAIQSGAPVELVEAEGEPQAVVVRQALVAAVANLVENAVQASPEGAPVEIAVAREDDQVTITVADRGPGLPEEVRQRLFSPHVTTKVNGSGMGLFLARQLVVGLHGGRLDILDRPGGGTVATIRLPAAGEDGDGG